jgi:transcriptional regulator with XRE-family HTH domain
MIAFVIQEARRHQKLSLDTLAKQAGVSKATLSRWETGKARPYAPELARVLKFLAIPEAVQRQCFQQLGTSQAERYLTKTTAESASLPISGGELLRALRNRARLPQRDAAVKIGVSQGLLSRWEGNDCWPDSETLARYCAALGATQGEQYGLIAHAWKCHDELPRDKDALDRARRELSILPHHFEHDLLYLALGSRYQSLYKASQIGVTDMLEIWGYFGSYLAWHHREDEAYRLTLPVFEEMKASHHPLSGGQHFALGAMG